MKHIAIIFLFVFMSCKNEKTSETISEDTSIENVTETEIDKSVTAMWQSFTKANSEFKDEAIPKSWFFHNNQKDADQLAKLVVIGKKQAGSGLYTMYEAAGVDLPTANTKHIITNFNGEAQAIINVIKVDTIPFNKISKNYAALDMGTTIEPLLKWRKAHWDFFKITLKEMNQIPSENTLVVCEWFETILPVIAK